MGDHLWFASGCTIIAVRKDSMSIIDCRIKAGDWIDTEIAPITMVLHVFLVVVIDVKNPRMFIVDIIGWTKGFGHRFAKCHDECRFV